VYIIFGLCRNIKLPSGQGEDGSTGPSNKVCPGQPRLHDG